MGFRWYGAVGSPLAAAVLVEVDVGVVIGVVVIVDAGLVVVVRADAVDVGVVAAAVGVVVDG